MRPGLDLSIYLVTDPGLCASRGLVETVLAAVRGGATVVQLRDKNATDAALIEEGRALKAALDGSGVPLIVNDRLEVALAVGADGVHVGQSDAAAAAARAALGPEAIVGLSIQSSEHADAVDPLVGDYLGVGPVFATGTKPDHAPPLGLDGLAAICAATHLPTVAIGGLGAGHASSVLAAGADGLAVVSAICGTADPQRAAREIALALAQAKAGLLRRS
jgi:thiamine-phosphate pyrophosphorylase